MTPLSGLLLLFAIAYLGAFVFQRFALEKTWIKLLLYSGVLNLFIGYFIGPHGIALFSEDVMNKLYVLVGLVLGWAGFLIGLQAKWSELKRFQSIYFMHSVIYFLFVFSGLLIVTLLINHWLKLNLSFRVILPALIIGTVSSPILIGLLKEHFNLRGPAIHFLQFSVALDNMFGVVTLGIVLLMFNQLEYVRVQSVIFIFGIVVFSIFMALLFTQISRLIDNIQQFFLVLIGFLLILVGVSLNLDVSVILVSFIFGTVVSNLPADTKTLYQAISGAEKPLYYLMMIFIGSSISPPNWQIILIAFALTIFRLVIKYLAGRLSPAPSVIDLDSKNWLGPAQIGMGGIALAMSLDYRLTVVNTFSQTLLLLVSLMAIMNVLLSPLVFNVTKKI